MKDPDDIGYLGFTAPQERDKALSELRGVLQGFTADREFHPKEVRELRDWQVMRQHLMIPQDFKEINQSITRAVEDNRLEQWEVDEIKALCERAASNAPYYNAVTRALQELFGYLHGILTDRVIKTEELNGLLLWMDDYNHLSGVYPFTEVEALVVEVMKDKTVDENEQKMLQAFFSQFVNLSPAQKDFSQELELNAKELCLGGICAVTPTIQLGGSMFCFTGFSARGTRLKFAEKVVQCRGVYHDSVIQDLDYLVVGSESNRSWAYACYGRKVEAAVLLRKKGHGLQIIHEADFWDATAD